MRKGILVAGNWIIDQVKVIDVYPKEEALANILEEYTTNGGCAYNVTKALKRLGFAAPITAVGMVGDDENGNNILKDCLQMGVEVVNISTTNLKPTSYTNVMTVKSTGMRTFFHNRGANALLNNSHFQFESNSKIFHLGYLLLLDELDSPERDGQTHASKLLKQAQEKGFLTSVDLVSEDSERFRDVVSPSLPYINYLFMNEFELSRLTGMPTQTNGKTSLNKCISATKKVFENGFEGLLIVHFKEGAVAIDKDNSVFFQTAIKIEATKIGSTVGAGDAFAAGVLFGIHENWPVQKSLELGVATAFSSLQHVSPSEGIQPYTACLDIAKLYNYDLD